MIDRVALERILTTLSSRAGLLFPQARHGEVESAVARMLAEGYELSPSRLARGIERGEIDIAPLLEQLRVGETYFFRHPRQFEFLREVVIPDCRAVSGSRDIHVWSAGCASGEEAYSIAIVLDQAGLGARARVLGTDISPSALEKARAAEYKPWSFRGEDAGDTSPYFETRGNRRVVRESIRRMVTFAELNLAGDDTTWLRRAPTEVDVLFIRNVLIYFDEQTVRRVATRLYSALRPGGWLIAAASDPLLDRFAPFEPVLHESGVYLRRPLGDSGVEPQDVQVKDVAPTLLEAAKPRPRRQVTKHTVDLHSGARRNVERRQAPRTPSPSSRADETPSDGDVARLVRSAASAARADRIRLLSEAVADRPTDVHLQFVLGMTQMEMGLDDAAMASMRRVLYLDRGTALAHFVLALLLGRNGEIEAARRSLRAAETICTAHASDDAVPPEHAMTYEELCASIESYRTTFLLDKGRER